MACSYRRFAFSLALFPVLALGACTKPEVSPSPRKLAPAEALDTGAGPKDDNFIDASVEPKQITLAELNAKTPPVHKGKWSAEGAIKLEGRPLEIDLGGLHKEKELRMTFGNAFAYWVYFYNGDEQVGRFLSNPFKKRGRDVLVARVFEAPAGAVEKGYDMIRIEPFIDQRQSVARLQFFNPTGAKDAAGAAGGEAEAEAEDEQD